MKVLLIIANKGFKDEELLVPYSILVERGVEIASDKKGVAQGADGEQVRVDLSLEEVVVSDFDGIYFIGGPRALEFLNNEASYSLLERAVEAGLGIGAICISPVILAEGGFLDGKRATVWSTDVNRGPVKRLEAGGAEYVDQDVVRDGSIITANGPQSAAEFGREILDFLRSRD